MILSVQDAVADVTQEALEDLIKSIRRMPFERLTWRPMDLGRTALDQFQECATSPAIYRSRILRIEQVDQREERKLWDVDETERRARSATAELLDVIRGIDGERFSEEVPVSWGTTTILELMWMHLWNLNYHLGSVNHIQTLYGDLDMA